MNTYVSLLRGINVSGQKPVRMPELKSLYESLGFEQVVTYVQSGNVVFTSSVANRLELADLIEAGILQSFGFQVPVFIRDGADLQQIKKDNPFIHQEGVALERLYVTFLASPPAQKNLADLEVPPQSPDEYRVIGSEIYLHCPVGYGRTYLSNNYFEKKLGQTATTRNWKTVMALCDLSNDDDR